MKIISETKTGYLCDLTAHEVAFILKGDEFASIKPQELLGIDVKVCELFSRCRRIETFREKKEYDSVRGQLKSLLVALTPIENFVSTIEIEDD